MQEFNQILIPQRVMQPSKPNSSVLNCFDGSYYVDCRLKVLIFPELFKIKMVHISREAELEVLASMKERKEGVPESFARVTRTEILDARNVVENQIHVDQAIHECIVDIAGNTRADKRLLQGISTRASR